MTPKVFFQHFLQSAHSDLALLRRFWAQPTGIESTMQLVQALRKEITKTKVGVAAWGDLIQNEVRVGLHVSYSLRSITVDS
jgi:hypothetical protein